MKRLWVASAIILLLAMTAALHTARLGQLTEDIILHLEQADTCLQEEDWSGAAYAAGLAAEQWDANGFYLHVTLRHGELDEIRGSLREIKAYLKQGDDKAECRAATARLINQLELLVEAELPTVKNVL